ncbi:hypothetical protein OROMI_000853 [Orobanche minor]
MSDVAIMQRRVEELALEDGKRPMEEEEESDMQATGTDKGPPIVDGDDVSPMELQQESEDDQGSAEEYSDGEEYEAPEEIDRELIIKKLLENYHTSFTGPGYGYCSACVKNEVCKICRNKNGCPADYNPAELIL